MTKLSVYGELPIDRTPAITDLKELNIRFVSKTDEVILQSLKDTTVKFFNSICNSVVAEEKIKYTTELLDKNFETAIALSKFLQIKDIIEIFSLTDIAEFPINDSEKMVELAVQSNGAENIAFEIIQIMNK